MIRRSGKDWKADWAKHLSKLVHAYNSMRLAVTRYSLHYLMFWVMTVPAYWLLFSHYCEHRKTPVCWSLHCWLMWMTAQSLQRKCKHSAHLRLKGRGDTMIVRPIPFHWNQVTWSWQMQMPTKGGEKWKTGGRRNHMKWNAGLLKASHHTLWRTSGPDAYESSIGIGLLLITPIMGAFLYTSVWAEQTRCATTVLEEPTQKVRGNEKAPQSAKCLPLAQHQTGETPLGWVNRKLCAFLRTSSRASLLDQGWKVQCRGKGIHRCQCQHSGCRHTDHWWS